MGNGAAFTLHIHANNPSGDSDTTLTGGATEWKERKYNRDDLVDISLLNQVAKHVIHDKLGSLARDLNIEESVYAQLQSLDDKIWKVGRICFNPCFLPKSLMFRANQLLQ